MQARAFSNCLYCSTSTVLCTSQVSNMPSLAYRSRNGHFYAKYDGVVRCHSEQRGCRRGNFRKVSRFSGVSEVKAVKVLIIPSYSRHLEFFPNPRALLETCSSKDPKLILMVPASFSHDPSRSLFADSVSVPGNVTLLRLHDRLAHLGQTSPSSDLGIKNGLG